MRGWGFAGFAWNRVVLVSDRYLEGLRNGRNARDDERKDGARPEEWGVTFSRLADMYVGMSVIIVRQETDASYLLLGILLEGGSWCLGFSGPSS